MADSATPAIRQRKKRKWDQPGEAVAMAAYPVSAMPGMLFGGAGNSTGLGMPNMLASLVGAFPKMTLAMPPVPYSALCSTVANNAAVAIVQKINQLKDTTERIKSVDAAAALVEEMMKQGLPSAGTDKMVGKVHH